jgi:hypothetical protein
MSRSDPVAVAVRQIKQVPEGVPLEHLLQQLTSAQNIALSNLAEGESHKNVAVRAGVNRTTLYRWLNFDPVFRAAHNLWHKEAADSVRTRLLKIAEDAVATVGKAVAEGDRKLAYGVLKDLGLLGRVKDIPTEPALIQQQMELDCKQQSRKMNAQALRELFQEAGLSLRQQRELLLEAIRDEQSPPPTPASA